MLPALLRSPSETAQEYLTNSNDEFVRCVSDTLNEILHSCETAHAPLGGASPQFVESVSENEVELPAVTDCTTRRRVDAVQGKSAFLLAENQNYGVEPKDCHVRVAAHKGESSAAPVPNPEKWSHEAIVARSNMRPERMQKLKVATNSGQNPGFEYLQEC